MADTADMTIKEIVGSIRRIVRSISLDSKKMVKRFGLTGPQSLVLRSLASHGTLSSADLSRMLYVTPSNMTGVIDRLEKHGLINRIKKETDRRVSLIELTEKGSYLSQTLPDPIEEKLISGLAYLEPTEIFGIYSAFKKIVDLIDATEITDTPIDDDAKTWRDLKEEEQ